MHSCVLIITICYSLVCIDIISRDKIKEVLTSSQSDMTHETESTILSLYQIVHNVSEYNGKMLNVMITYVVPSRKMKR